MEIIVGKTAGFCYGVKRAVEGAKKEIKENKKISCLGEIVHNRQVIEELKKIGMDTIENIEEVEDNEKILIRAHGVPKEIYEIAKKRNIELIDYTCPNVLKIHNIVNEYVKKGYYILLCGSSTHPENIGTLSYCKNNYFVIEKEDEALKAIEAIKKQNRKQVLLISQTTYSLEKFYIIEEILKNELPKNIKLEICNSICNATEIRQLETKKLAKEVDFMIIIGGKNSSNTKKLYEIAKKENANTILIESAKEMDDVENKYNKIGIMAGASTPKKSIEEVVTKLNEEVVKI